MSTSTRAGSPSDQAQGFGWRPTSAVVWGLLGAVPPALAAVVNLLLFEYLEPLARTGIWLELAVVGVILLAVALVTQARTRRAAHLLFVLAAVLTVLWPMCRGALVSELAAVAFSAVPLLLAAQATATLRGHPVRLPLARTAVVAAAVVAALSLTTLYAGGWTMERGYRSLAQHPDPAIPGTVFFLRTDANSGCLWKVPASGGAEARLWCTTEGYPNNLGYQQATGRVLIEVGWNAGNTGAIWVDPTSGAQLRRVDDIGTLATGSLLPLPGSNATRSPDGAWLTVDVQRTTHWLAFIARNTISATAPAGSTWTVAQAAGRPDHALDPPIWSPDGQWVLVIDNRSRVLIVAAEGSPGLRELVHGVDSATWAPVEQGDSIRHNGPVDLGARPLTSWAGRGPNLRPDTVR